VKTTALYLLSIKSYLENGKVSSILKRIIVCVKPFSIEQKEYIDEDKKLNEIVKRITTLNNME
jgi:hypothetical protein